MTRNLFETQTIEFPEKIGSFEMRKDTKPL